MRCSLAARKTSRNRATCAVLAGLCFAANVFIFAPRPQMHLWMKAIAVLGVSGVGAAVFFGVAYLLRVTELEDVAKRKAMPVPD